MISSTAVLSLLAVIMAGGFYSLVDREKVSASDVVLQEEFAKWRKYYGKEYQSPSEQYHRFQIFKKSFLHVKKISKSSLTYEVHLGQFADIDDEEFEASFLGHKINDFGLEMGENLVQSNLNEDKLDLPESFDWVKKGALPPIRNQGKCGGCYTFATVAAVEAAHFIRTGQILQFSEQQILSCSNSYGNLGCQGGRAWAAFSYLRDQGAMKRSDYPYTGVGTDDCKYDRSKSIRVVSGFTMISGDILKTKAILTTSPQAISVDALPLKHYKSGIFSDENLEVKCQLKTNHAVLLVGYGIENGIEFWKVRNSWGHTYGEDGYFRIVMDNGTAFGMCSVNSNVVGPVFDDL